MCPGLCPPTPLFGAHGVLFRHRWLAHLEACAAETTTWGTSLAVDLSCIASGVLSFTVAAWFLAEVQPIRCGRRSAAFLLLRSRASRCQLPRRGIWRKYVADNVGIESPDSLHAIAFDEPSFYSR